MPLPRPLHSHPALRLLRRRARPGPAESPLLAGLAEPLVPGNRVDLLQDGPDTYAAMYEAIAEARDHVHLESYIFEADGPGAEFARRLLERARAGVRVHVIYDAFGSIGTPASYFEALRAGGVAVCEFNTLRRLRTLLSRALHLRDHRKLMVVDGRVGFVGGVNISKVYSAGSSPLGSIARRPPGAPADEARGP
ncbi:MAG TPA: phospholipase D-like domain-containing protein, partial [Burkholderiaceae bacterium]